MLAVLAGLLVLGGSERTVIAAPARITGTAHAYLRSGPGAEYPPIGTMTEGEAVDALETSGLWTKIETSSGKIGYIFHAYVTPAAPVPAEPPVARAAPVAPSAVEAPTAVATPTVEISADLAALKAEIAALKEKVKERPQEEATEARAEIGAPATPSPLPGVGGLGPASEPSVGALAVGLVAFILGCFAGSALTRRRSRTHRSRLRF